MAPTQTLQIIQVSISRASVQHSTDNLAQPTTSYALVNLQVKTINKFVQVLLTTVLLERNKQTTNK